MGVLQHGTLCSVLCVCVSAASCIMHCRHCLPTVHTSLPNTTTFTPLLFSTATTTATALRVRLNVPCDLPLELRPQASPPPSMCSCQARVIQTAASAWLIRSRSGSGSRLETAANCLIVLRCFCVTPSRPAHCPFPLQCRGSPASANSSSGPGTSASCNAVGGTPGGQPWFGGNGTAGLGASGRCRGASSRGASSVSSSSKEPAQASRFVRKPTAV
jgi:hypothetical protein